MTTENEADMQTSAEPRATDSGVVTGIPGIIAHLGELESGAIIQEKGLCMLFDRKTDSIPTPPLVSPSPPVAPAIAHRNTPKAPERIAA